MGPLAQEIPQHHHSAGKPAQHPNLQLWTGAPGLHAQGLALEALWYGRFVAWTQEKQKLSCFYTLYCHLRLLCELLLRLINLIAQAWTTLNVTSQAERA